MQQGGQSLQDDSIFVSKYSLVQYFNTYVLPLYSVVGFLILLNQYGFISIGFVEITKISPEIGYAYVAELNIEHVPNAIGRWYQLYQDGVLLERHSLHADIREKGDGLYDISDGILRFSTTNNSPVSSHVFTFNGPLAITDSVFYVIMFSLLCSVVWLYKLLDPNFSHIKKLIKFFLLS